MTITTNVPIPTLGPNGIIIPTEAAVLAGVQQDWNAAFGGNLNPDLNTPQGQMASSEAAIIGNANDDFVFLANQFDPAYATGRYQDAIARIYFLERLPSQPTVVQAICTGGEGVVIPVGALAKAADGNLYTCTEQGVIPNTGTITLSFACNVVGPIVCPANSLDQIYQLIPGWDTIHNQADGVVGQNVESRAAFEARRAASVALNSNGSLPSILGAVLAVPGVLDAYVTENTLNTSTTIGGVTLSPHSLYVAVVGGLAQDVGRAIWSRKAPGCAYNGNTTVTVTDSNSGYTPPLPTYQVTFQIPASLPILFAVNLVNSLQVPANAAVLIQNAIIAAFAGEDGGQRIRIGTTVYASRFYAIIAALGPWAQIISILVGSINTTLATAAAASIAGTTLTIGGAVTGAFAIGQTVVDVNGVILPGTVITAGAGSSWTVSQAQTVGPIALAGIKATLNDVPVNINQEPTVNAANITVTLS